MKLLIETPGTSVGKEGKCFKISAGENTVEYPAVRIQQILIAASASVTSDAVELAAEHDIHLAFLGARGRPVASLFPAKHGSTAAIRRNQLRLTESGTGTEIVKEWLIHKMNNQARHLRKIARNFGANKINMLHRSAEKIENQIEALRQVPSIPIHLVRNTIGGHEGTASRTYFEALGKIVPVEYRFKGRSKRPAKDMFNSMLNYAYGVLYTNVERSCFGAGMDPYIGIMHVDQYNRATFTHDLVEIFRIYAEETVYSLFASQRVTESMFDAKGNGLWLNHRGRNLLIGALNDKFNERVRYKGRQVKIQNIFDLECHAIAQRILKGNPDDHLGRV